MLSFFGSYRIRISGLGFVPSTGMCKEPHSSQQNCHMSLAARSDAEKIKCLATRDIIRLGGDKWPDLERAPMSLTLTPVKASLSANHTG